MKTPKKLLQDWLGITSLAIRVAEIDIEEVTHTTQKITVDKGSSTPNYDVIHVEEVVIKGYEKDANN